MPEGSLLVARRIFLGHPRIAIDHLVTPCSLVSWDRTRESFGFRSCAPPRGELNRFREVLIWPLMRLIRDCLDRRLPGAKGLVRVRLQTSLPKSKKHHLR